MVGKKIVPNKTGFIGNGYQREIRDFGSVLSNDNLLLDYIFGQNLGTIP